MYTHCVRVCVFCVVSAGNYVLQDDEEDRIVPNIGFIDPCVKELEFLVSGIVQFDYAASLELCCLHSFRYIYHILKCFDEISFCVDDS